MMVIVTIRRINHMTMATTQPATILKTKWNATTTTKTSFARSEYDENEPVPYDYRKNEPTTSSHHRHQQRPSGSAGAIAPQPELVPYQQQGINSASAIAPTAPYLSQGHPQQQQQTQGMSSSMNATAGSSLGNSYYPAQTQPATQRLQTTQPDTAAAGYMPHFLTQTASSCIQHVDVHKSQPKLVQSPIYDKLNPIHVEEVASLRHDGAPPGTSSASWFLSKDSTLPQPHVTAQSIVPTTTSSLPVPMTERIPLGSHQDVSSHFNAMPIRTCDQVGSNIPSMNQAAGGAAPGTLDGQDRRGFVNNNYNTDNFGMNSNTVGQPSTTFHQPNQIPNSAGYPGNTEQTHPPIPGTMNDDFAMKYQFNGSQRPIDSNDGNGNVHPTHGQYSGISWQDTAGGEKRSGPLWDDEMSKQMTQPRRSNQDDYSPASKIRPASTNRV